MAQSLKTVTPNNTLIFDIADVKAYCKIVIDDDDAIIKELLLSAKFTAEKYLNRNLLSTALEMYFDGFSYIQPENTINYSDIPFLRGAAANPNYSLRYLQLLRAPIISVSSVVITKADNTTATIDSSKYFTDNLGRVVFDETADFSDLRDAAAIKVSYTAGYGTKGSDIPFDIALAIKNHVFTMYNAISTKTDAATDPFKLPDGIKQVYMQNRLINGI